MRLVQLGTMAGCALVAGALVLGSGAVAQDDGRMVEVKGKQAKGGDDPNIADSSSDNDPNARVTAPPSKGGPEPKGRFCLASIDNWTRLFVQFYLDGKYQA